jgi:hypothetical protein
MEPASTIIKAFGGPGAVSAAAGVHRTRVWKWTQPREKGGTGGVIPHWHVRKLLEHASAKGIAITPADFAPTINLSVPSSDFTDFGTLSGA